ncbi:molybdopterin-dependent oxidoreductase [Roseiarcaceae bacterium H3SJ34-1]|uniref:molybdopterin-dependent oxidoreductase n=1 Tax=Terripilifer ovatus TaxID=3032367 RepID=UPI003AB96A80|nr:molybdopterin-dependent oxidoreductase [Roseiarcaceae bacterium H3SJ34-1]
MVTRRQSVVLIGSAFFVPAIGGAQTVSLGIPSGKPILRITGKISRRNDNDAAVFDGAMLESLGMVSFETMTPWYTDKVMFEGVPMAKLLASVGASGDRVRVTALNDYTSEIPVEDFEKYGVILALKRNGQYMPVSDKGPLFIVYPFDAVPELKSQKFYSRSAWQVARMEVR